MTIDAAPGESDGLAKKPAPAQSVCKLIPEGDIYHSRRLDEP